MELTTSQIRDFLWSEGATPWKGELYGDAIYRTVSQEYLLGTFHTFWRKYVKARGIRHIEGRFECEDFCISYLAQLKESVSNILASPAVGMFWYKVDKYNRLIAPKMVDGIPTHSVIFAIQGKSLAKLNIYFIEPQSDQPLNKLSASEIQNCTGIYV